MDSYLEIAVQVLRAAKRPMTPKAIFDAALKAEIVPSHLYGKTQHKTLQARLSEEILHNRASSAFYRTEPGYFFLSEFMSDPSIPDKFKEPFPARRRTRDLLTRPRLVVDVEYLNNIGSFENCAWVDFIFKAFEDDAARYIEPKEKNDNTVPVWTFSLVRRDSFVLSYRLGRYRDDRDCFANKKTIGFPGAICLGDQTLFSEDDLGASESALAALLTDLDLSSQAFDDGVENPKITSLLHIDGDEEVAAFLIILEWSCPNWFEPTARKLSINNPMWIDVDVQPNDLHDYEPWSASTLEKICERQLWLNHA